MKEPKNEGLKKGAEPQSYGSNGDWLSGKTGQTVEETPQRTDRHDERFYESRHEIDPDSSKGGEVNEVQAAESDSDAPLQSKTSGSPATESAGIGVSGDSDQRKSFFRDRDYK
jgi:hypothetical protein